MTAAIIYRKPGHTCSQCGSTKIDRRAKMCIECFKVKPRACQGCSAEFLPVAGRANAVYCSRECGFADRTHWGANQGATPEPRQCKVYFPTCCGCAHPFLARKSTQLRCTPCRKLHEAAYAKAYRGGRTQRPCCECGNLIPLSASGLSTTCGDQCRDAKAKKYKFQYKAARTTKDVRQRLCAECGGGFTPVYGMLRVKFCGEDCARSHRYRITSARRNVRVGAHGAESIDPLKVFAMDGWECQGCGCATPQRLRGTHDGNAPEMDHIIALGRGGTHTMANVQTLCRTCNILKGAMSMERFASIYLGAKVCQPT